MRWGTSSQPAVAETAGWRCFAAFAGYWLVGTNSTRRFWARPSAVLLVATG